MNEIAEQETGQDVPARDSPLPRRRRHGRVGLGMLATLALAGLILTFAVLSLSGRSVPVPEALRVKVETAINDKLGAEVVRIGGLALSVGRDGIPHVSFTDLTIGDPSDGAVAILNTLRARLSPGRLLRGEIAATRLVLDGAQITLRRTSEGDFAFRSGPTVTGEARSVPALFELVDRVFAVPALSSLRTVEAGGIVLSLEDARSGRIWQATNATLILRRADTATTLTLASDVFNGTDDVAGIQLSVARNRVTLGVSLGVSVRGMPASDIALQAPVLAWLGVLDAPLSGSVRTEIGADGQMTSLAGTLDIEAGALRPMPGVPPVAFRSARTYFTFDPARQRIDFSDIAVRSDRGGLTASGHTYLSELSGLWPRAFLGQFAVSQLEYDGGGIFEGPISLADLRADLRLRLDPFVVDIGQIAAQVADTFVRSSGRITAEPDGWHVQLDTQTDYIAPERVLAFWPTEVSRSTRSWLVNSLDAGTLTDVSSAFRYQTGLPPDIALSFDFEGGEVRFLGSMPPLTEAEGRATLTGDSFTLVLDGGRIDAGEAGTVDAAGSIFQVADTRPRPATGVIDIRAAGPLQAALAILDKPPLRIMQRAGRGIDIAKASAQAQARISLPLKDRIAFDEVDYSVRGTLSDVFSDSVAEGRHLTSELLDITLSPSELRIAGSMELDGVPARAEWRQPLGGPAGQGSRVEGTVTLSSEAVDAFGIPLPAGFLSGEGTGRFSLDMRPELEPRLVIASDLSGLGLSIEGIGWRKPASATGAFELAAILGERPAIEGFSLSAPGLTLEGTVDLLDSGQLGSASFQRIQVGDWLDGSVTLTPRGPGEPPAIALTGGRLDLRRFTSRERATGDGGPISLSLDQLVISDAVTLSPVVGRIEQRSIGLDGTFEARVNGITPVRGTLAPANAGTAVRIQSDDAGGVIRDAGLSPNARGGTLDLVLTPVVGAPGGTYDGQFLIEGIRLRNAPAMAGLLDAISVVGLLDQLRGPGIHFDTVDGRFRLTPERLTLTEAAAVGGSLGISASGIYDLVRKQMDISGVISPVYFVNGIGAVLTRRGEGLFGFNYRMTGSADAPRIGVNPLSILTPGIFREIFRRPPSRE